MARMDDHERDRHALSYSATQLASAVSYLAVESVSLPEKLKKAYSYALHLVRPWSLPKDCREQFATVMERLTSFFPPGSNSGAVDASVDLLTESDQLRIAATIQRVYERVRVELGRHDEAEA